RLDLPVILSVEANRILGNVTVGVAKTAVSEISLTQEQFFNIVLNAQARQIFVRRWRRRVPENVSTKVSQGQTRTRFIPDTVGHGPLEVPAHLDGVISLDPGKMFGPVISRIRTRHERIALNSANVAAVAQVIHVHIGHPEVGRAEGTCVDPEGLGVYLVVDTEKLCEPGIAKTALKNLGRAEVLNPTDACHLSPRRSNRVEQARIAARGRQSSKGRCTLETIAKNVSHRHRTTIIKFVVELDPEAVRTRDGWCARYKIARSGDRKIIQQ